MASSSNKRINKRDLIILSALLIIGVTGSLILYAGNNTETENGLFANVYFMGEPAFMVDLGSDSAFTLAEVLRLEPYNLPQVHFEVRDGAMAFVKSDCPDLLCIFMGPQSQLGGFAACLPNRLLFHIEKGEHSLYSTAFFDIFDTLIFLRLFSPSQSEFERYADAIYSELLWLHKLFDIFSEHDGINNIATINKMAGIRPVTVDETLIELISEGIAVYHLSGGAVNIAMGPVLRLWHSFLIGEADSPPNIEALEAAKLLSDINDVIIDGNQVFLAQEGMSLDVGALAKGFALERAYSVASELGVTSGIISIGGDMVIIGSPLDGRETWAVGIENPTGGLFATKHVVDTSIATSGNYQRFVIYGQNRYHHIIDPATLMPTTQFSSITVVHPSPRVAEFLSTAAFILPFVEGLELINEFGAEALWILPDGSYLRSDGFTFAGTD